MNPLPRLAGLLSLCLAGTGPLIAKDGGPPSNSALSEVYHVSQVRRSPDPRVRELLPILYREVAARFNEESARKFKREKRAYDGQRLRVLRVLGKAEGGGDLYLVGFQGELAVISWSGKPLREGQETPPLELAKDGTRKTKVTRLLERAAEDEGTPGDGVVTFFGIPLTFGGQEVRSSDGEAVTREETLPRYRATLSQKVLTEPPVMTKERFLNHLRNGNTYVVERTEERRCQSCRGFRRVPNDGTGPPAPDGKMDCPGCGAEGKRTWQVTYKIVW